MNRRSKKTVKSINFDNEVLEALENRCKKEKIDVSYFVNQHIRKVVLGEYEFFRCLAKFHSAELAKYNLLMNTSPDKPEAKR